MMSRSRYLKIKRASRTTRYITTSLLLTEIIIIAGIYIATILIGA